MAYLTAGLVVVAALCVLNVVLTVGVVRRLRQHDRMLAAGAGAAAPMRAPAPGDWIGPFTAETPGGVTVSRETLRPGDLVAFLSPGCGPCEEQLPGLVQWLRESEGTAAATLVVIVATPTEAADMVAALSPLANVVCEPSPRADIQAAFGVESYPIALTVDGSAITEVFRDLSRLPVRTLA
jgi:hypothetical protein